MNYKRKLHEIFPQLNFQEQNQVAKWIVSLKTKIQVEI